VIINKYPLLSKDVLVREEAEGGVFMSGSSPFKIITSRDLNILRRIDGKMSIIDIARYTSKNVTELAEIIIRIIDMAREGIIELKDEVSSEFRPVLLSEHLPFSTTAFSSPVLVSFGLTSECNRNCTHCYRTGIRESKALRHDAIISVIHILAELNIAELNFTGGEPFLNSDIVEYVSIAASMIHSVTISTNGTLLNSSMLHTLVKSKIKRIQIGINVMYDAQFTKYVDEDCKHITDILREATQEGIEIIIGAVLTRNLIENIESVFEIAEVTGVKVVRLGPMMNCGGACSASSIATRMVVDAVLKARRLGEERGVSVIFGDGLVRHNFTSRDLQGRKRYCFLGTGVLHVEPDGSIYPCSALITPKYRLGSLIHCLTSSELMSIWRNSDILNSLRDLTIDKLPLCSGCEIKNYCAGGCRTAAYWSTGDIAGVSPYCRVSRELLGEKCT
jgi:radical SAM protein with 4Fe4S-binding SPASM domain